MKNNTIWYAFYSKLLLSGISKKLNVCSRKNHLFQKKTQILNVSRIFTIPVELCGKFVTFSDFQKIQVSFKKTFYFFKKTQTSNVLKNFSISAAFYEKFATIWSKNNFTFSSVNLLAAVAWTQLANIGLKKRRKWSFWVEDFAFIFLRWRKIKIFICVFYNALKGWRYSSGKIWERTLPKRSGIPYSRDKHIGCSFFPQLQPFCKPRQGVYANLRQLWPQTGQNFTGVSKLRREADQRKNFRSYGSADYSAKKELLEQIDFVPKCYSDINQMCEMHDFLARIVEAHIPRRTRHRQSILPWITFSTSNLLNKLRTQKRLLLMKPATYRKMQVAKLRNNVIEAAEIDRTTYREKTMSTRDTNVIFKHLKSLNKSLRVPKVMVKDGRSASSINEKVNLLNDF